MRSQESWNRSAEAWIRFVDKGDPHRDVLLDPIMLELCGDVLGARVADIGCGEGRFCRQLAERGAQVTGVEPTEALLRAAMERGAETYVHARAEATGLPSEAFDLVVSYLALIDIDDLQAATREMARMLRPGGRAVVANLAPHATASGEVWWKDDEGRKIVYPLDRYAEARPIAVAWQGIEVVNWHRPLQDYLGAFIDVGLVLRRYLEPVPTKDQIKRAPNLADMLRVPIFAVMEWRKP